MKSAIALWIAIKLILDMITTPNFTFAVSFDGKPLNAITNHSHKVNFAKKKFPNNFNSLLNKSKILEDEIYSEATSNYRGGPKEEEKTKLNPKYNEIKSSIGKSEGTNKWGSQNNLFGLVNSVFLRDSFFQNNVNNFARWNKKGCNGWRNITKNINPPSQNEYFLGFGGSIFGNEMAKYNFPGLKIYEPFKSEISDPRQKRSVIHLYNMVLCATGCNPITYKGYGCYCGFLGSGFEVDGIDSCCKMHDRCYFSAGCPMFFEYFIPYLWKCYANQPLCAIDHGSFGGPGSCAQRICECDRQVALCLRKYRCPTSKALCTSSPWRLFQNILTL